MADRKLRADPADRIGRSGGARGRGKGRRRGPAPRRKRGGRRRLVRALKFGVLGFLWAAILGAGTLAYFALTLPPTGDLTKATRRPSITVLAADGSLLTTYGDLFGKPLGLKQMSPYLPEAVIATEDRRFYSNIGIDPIGLARAALADLMAGHIVQGGSTITQQLAKNLFLTPKRTIARKVREILLALWLDHEFTKKQILEIYLNRVYLGAGTYGVDAAAHRYFGKPARDLTLYESATIAGLLKAPSLFNPARDPARARARTAQVLDNMVDAGYITARRRAAAIGRGASFASVPVTHPDVRYFTDWVVSQAKQYIRSSDHELTILTTLDPRLQQEAGRAIDHILARDGRKDRVGQGALVALSPDGAVRAMVGGADYEKSQYNRATQAERQPGSAFKPFVYLAGLEAGLRPDDRLVDGPIRIGNWRPQDYSHRYLGEVTMAEGLAKSLNTVAARVAERAGLDRVVAVAHRLGIASPLKAEPSLALGTGAVNLLELVSAYAPFANGGYGVWPHAVIEIRDKRGKVLYRRSGSGPGRVVALQYVGMMNAMLRGVVTDGTGRNAALARPDAGKTGTTQDYRDAWFVGYTRNLVAGVWFGNDDDAPMRRVTGGSLPAEAWHRFMRAATRPMPVRPLPGAPGYAGPVAAAPAGGGLLDNLISLFSAPSPPRRAAPPPDFGLNAGY